MRHLLPLLLLLAADALAAGPQRFQRRYAMPPFRTEAGETVDTTVLTRDGVELATRVHTPAGEGPWPVILTRTPYPMKKYLDSRCEVFVRYGYACVWQFVRGQGKSGGDWIPFEREPHDGLDTLAWLDRQPWSAGRVALLGESYMAGVQWAIASDLPESVRTMVPTVFGADTYASAYEGGMFRHDILTAWMALIPERGMRFFAGGPYRKALTVRPRTDMDLVAAKTDLPWFDTWLAADTRSHPYWQRDDVRAVMDAPAKLDIPVLMMAGWADAFLGTQLTTWDELATAENSRLIIGPWDHTGKRASDVDMAGVDDATGDGSMLQLAQILDWFDTTMAPDAPPPIGRTLTYVVGDDRWAGRPSWPPATVAHDWFPGPGDADTCEAALAPTPTDVPMVRFVHDPEDPAPSVGGAGLLAGAIPLFGKVAPGFRESHAVCTDRADVLGFTSAALDAPMHLAGRMTAHLRVASSADDSAFVVRVSDVFPDGTVVVLRETIRALTMRAGDDARVPYTAGEAVDLRLETWPLEYVLQPGHRLRMEIASSAFPKFEAHPNVAGPWAEVTTTLVANQTVWPDRSRLTLPVIP